MENGIQSTELLTDAGLYPESPGKLVRSQRPRPATRDSRPTTWESCKRIVDLVGSAVLILLLAPLYLIIATILYLTGRSVLFGQIRIGRNGAPFVCYKFRTMVPDAHHKLNTLLKENPELEQEWLRTQKLANDPRITSLGRFLRKTSLDELPQLFNVLKGNMSLVGPRPVLRQEVLRYGRAARWYLSVRPGMTGLWQVCRDEETDYTRRVAMDTYYVRHSSLGLDFWVLLKTFSAVIQKGEGS